MTKRSKVAPRHRRRVRTRSRVVVVVVVVALVVASGLALIGLTWPHEDDEPLPAGQPRTRLVNQATEAEVRAESDAFGITFLHPTLRRGTYWTSQWETARSFSGVDPQDPWFDADHGAGSYRAGGGELAVTGSTPRMYVHDPRGRRQWGDVEITVYAKRVDDEGIPFAGITAVARSNHLETEGRASDLCDTRGYAGRLRFDGYADFSKETAHPHSEATSSVRLFRDGLPTGVWIGVKYVVYDARDGVHLELWVDRTDGRDGGDWELVNVIVDDGFRFGEVPCAPGMDPQLALTRSPNRRGSESGQPNRTVYFRSDGIAPEGLVYKWASIREISP